MACALASTTRPASAPCKRPGSASSTRAGPSTPRPNAKRPGSAPSSRPVVAPIHQTLSVKRPQSATFTVPVSPPKVPKACGGFRGSNRCRFFDFFEPPRKPAVATPRRRPTSARTVVAAEYAPFPSENAPVPWKPSNDRDPVFVHSLITREMPPPPPPPPVRSCPVRPPSPSAPMLSLTSSEHKVERVLWAMQQHGHECEQVSAEWLQRAHQRVTPSAPRGRPKSAPPLSRDGGSEDRAKSSSPGPGHKSLSRKTVSSPHIARKRPLSAKSSPGLASGWANSSGNTTIKFGASPRSAHVSSPASADSADSPRSPLQKRAQEAAREKRRQQSLARVSLDDSITVSTLKSTPKNRVSSPAFNQLLSAKADKLNPFNEKRSEPVRRQAFQMTDSTKQKFASKANRPEVVEHKILGQPVEFRILAASSEKNHTQEAAQNLATTIDGQPFGWQANGVDRQWIVFDAQTALTITALTINLEGGWTNPCTCTLQFAVRYDKFHPQNAWTTACEFDIGEQDTVVSRNIDYEGVMQVTRFKSMLIKRYGSVNRAWRRILDTSGDGKLQYEEFVKACNEIGYKPPRGVTLDSLYLELDSNGDGVIKASDINNAKSSMPRTRYWRLLFGRTWGAERNLHGEHADIKICAPLRVFSTDILAVPRNEARAKALSNMLSEQMSRKVSAFSDDIQLSEEEIEIRDLAKKHGIGLLQVERVKKQFDEADTGGNGSISFTEFKSLMMTLMEAKEESDVPPSRIEFFWQMVDVDQSGSVEFEEFLLWQNAYFEMFDDSCHAPMSELAERFYAHAMEGRIKQARAWAEENPIRHTLGNFALSKIGERQCSITPSPEDSEESDGGTKVRKKPGETSKKLARKLTAKYREALKARMLHGTME